MPEHQGITYYHIHNVIHLMLYDACRWRALCLALNAAETWCLFQLFEHLFLASDLANRSDDTLIIDHLDESLIISMSMFVV